MTKILDDTRGMEREGKGLNQKKITRKSEKGNRNRQRYNIAIQEKE